MKQSLLSYILSVFVFVTLLFSVFLFFTSNLSILKIIKDTSSYSVSENYFLLIAISLIILSLSLLFKNKIETKIEEFKNSNPVQGVAIFIGVVLATSGFEMFKDGKITIMYMVFTISFLTIVINTTLHAIFYRKDRLIEEKHLNDKLKLLNNIMSQNGFKQIINVKEVQKIEENSDTIVVFTENLETDYGEQQIGSNKGLLSESVAKNLNDKKEYTYRYFLKNNQNNKKAIKKYIEYMMNEKSVKNLKAKVEFFLIYPEDYHFFSEVYIYKQVENKKAQEDIAVEWMPSLGKIGDADDQYYVKLASSQVLLLNEVIINLSSKYSKYIPEGMKNE